MSNYKFETLQLHVGQEKPDPASDARAVPIYATTSYVFHNSQHAADRFGLADAGNIYGRLTNSTQAIFEERIAALEGGVAGLAVASGAAAITYTIQALASQGEHIVAQKTIYGGTSNLLAHTLPLYGIESTFVDVHNLKEVEDAIQPNTKHPDHTLYEKYFPNGGASIFTFEIKGGQEEAFRFIDNLKIFSLLANVADVKSLVIHPATTTHSQLTDEKLANVGISRSTIRLSIGTEHIDDIIADLDQAFDAV